jgi:hypothetical protein
METIANLHNIRAIVLDPISGAPFLCAPEEIEAMHDGEGVRCLGVVGTRRSVCATLRGDLVIEEPCVLRVASCPALPAALCAALLDEYAATVPDAPARATIAPYKPDYSLPWLEQVYALPDLRG